MLLKLVSNPRSAGLMMFRPLVSTSTHLIILHGILSAAKLDLAIHSGTLTCLNVGKMQCVMNIYRLLFQMLEEYIYIIYIYILLIYVKFNTL